jgi:hypothetical protein
LVGDAEWRAAPHAFIYKRAVDSLARHVERSRAVTV